MTRLFSPTGYHSIRLTSNALQHPKLYSQEAASAESSPEVSSKSASTVKNEVAKYEEEEDDKLYKKLEVELRGHDPAVLQSYEWFARTAAEHLNIEVGKW